MAECFGESMAYNDGFPLLHPTNKAYSYQQVDERKERVQSYPVSSTCLAEVYQGSRPFIDEEEAHLLYLGQDNIEAEEIHTLGPPLHHPTAKI